MPPAPPVTIATSVTVKSLLVGWARRSGEGGAERVAGRTHGVGGDREHGLGGGVAVNHAVVGAVVVLDAGRAQVVAVLLRLHVQWLALGRLDLRGRQAGGVAEH